MNWREMRDLHADNIEAWVAIDYFYEQQRKLKAMDNDELRAYHTKWSPKRESLIRKFAAGSIEAQKMDAFFVALDESVDERFPPKTKRDEALDYIYEEEERA